MRINILTSLAVIFSLGITIWALFFAQPRVEYLPGEEIEVPVITESPWTFTEATDSSEAETIVITKWKTKLVPQDPDTIFVDESLAELMSLRQYISTKHIFKIRFVSPLLQVSFISADTASVDTIKATYELAEYTVLTPGFQFQPLNNGEYVLQGILPLEAAKPKYTTSSYVGLEFPLGLYGQTNIDWNRFRGTFALHVNSDAGATARIAIDYRIK